MKTIVFLVFLFFINQGFSQKEFRLLKKAYEEKSVKKLDKFYNNWNKEIKPITENELVKLNLIQKYTYKVIFDFYQPDSLFKIGSSEWGDSIYNSVKFYIIKNSIYIQQVDKLFYSKKELDSLKDYIDSMSVLEIKLSNISEKQKKILLNRDKNGELGAYVKENFGPINSRPIELNVDSIMNFKPLLKNNKVKPLFLNSKYKTILDSFLGHSNLVKTTYDSLGKMKKFNISDDKKSFLETNYIKIVKGHWFGWQLCTFPCIYRVIFDKEFKYAKIEYNVLYNGGEAILTEVNGKWKIISYKWKWVE